MSIMPHLTDLEVYGVGCRVLRRSSADCSTNLMMGKHAGNVTSLEYLVRRPLGAEALEASYFKGPEHVEEASE